MNNLIREIYNFSKEKRKDKSSSDPVKYRYLIPTALVGAGGASALGMGASTLHRMSVLDSIGEKTIKKLRIDRLGEVPGSKKLNKLGENFKLPTGIKFGLSQPVVNRAVRPLVDQSNINGVRKFLFKHGTKLSAIPGLAAGAGIIYLGRRKEK